MIEPWLVLAGIVVSAAASYGAARYSGRASSKVGQEANAVTFSRDLIARIEGLEDDVKKMRQELDNVKAIKGVAVTFIERILMWVHSGSNKPTPRIPSVIEPFLSEEIVATHKRIVLAEQDSP
jgi:outer membrane murein-binding lipoprotein Lpp